MIRISVILPTYNSEKTLQRTLDSIFAQEGLNVEYEFEILVVDDCSTDSTAEILRRNGISFLSAPFHTGGPNRGRNIALKRVTGEYICLIDHDDVWHPAKTLMQLGAAYYVPIVSTNLRVVDHTTNQDIIFGANDGSIRYYHDNVTFLSRLSRKKTGQMAYLSTLMYSGKLKEITFEEHFGSLDFDWALRLFEGRPSFEVGSCLMTRYVDYSNLSLSCEYVENDYYYSLRVLEMYDTKYPQETRAGAGHISGRRARYHYLSGDMKNARKYFLRADISVKTILYLLTSFFGGSWVRKNFRIYG